MSTSGTKSQRLYSDQTPYAEPWRRALALAVDALLLSLAGTGIGMLFRNALIRVGIIDGNIAGFGIAVIYFSILNSSMGEGRSIGKRIFGIRVAGRDGRSISLYRSIIRSLILILPILLNGIMPPFSSIEPRRLPAISALFTFATIGLGLSTVYLAIFNRRTGQAFHDLLCGTYVVKNEAETDIDPRPVSKFHFLIISTITAAAVLFPLSAILNTPAESLVDRYNLHKEISKLDEAIDHITLFEGLEPSPEPSSKESSDPSPNNASGQNDVEYMEYFEAVVFVNRDIDPESLAQKIADVILRTPRYREKENIIIIIRYGFDIGIASDYKSSRFGNPPEMWAKGSSKREDDLVKPKRTIISWTD